MLYYLVCQRSRPRVLSWAPVRIRSCSGSSCSSVLPGIRGECSWAPSRIGPCSGHWTECCPPSVAAVRRSCTACWVPGPLAGRECLRWPCCCVGWSRIPVPKITWLASLGRRFSTKRRFWEKKVVFRKINFYVNLIKAFFFLW